MSETIYDMCRCTYCKFISSPSKSALYGDVLHVSITSHCQVRYTYTERFNRKAEVSEAQTSLSLDDSLE